MKKHVKIEIKIRQVEVTISGDVDSEWWDIAAVIEITFPSYLSVRIHAYPLSIIPFSSLLYSALVFSFFLTVPFLPFSSHPFSSFLFYSPLFLSPLNSSHLFPFLLFPSPLFSSFFLSSRYFSWLLFSPLPSLLLPPSFFFLHPLFIYSPYRCLHLLIRMSLTFSNITTRAFTVAARVVTERIVKFPSLELLPLLLFLFLSSPSSSSSSSSSFESAPLLSV